MKQQSYIHPDAIIGKDVTISPFCYIDADVVVGDGTWLGPNVTLFSGARIGKDIVMGGKGSCVICHNFGWSRTKKVGPSLWRLTRQDRVNPEYLLKSMIDPSDFVVKGFGDEKVSAMPDMKKTLTKMEIRDIVSYLETLK